MVLKWQPWKLKSSIKLQNLHSMDESNANFCHAILPKCLKFNLEKLFLVVEALQPQHLVISSYFRYNCQQVYGLSWQFYTADRSWARHFNRIISYQKKTVALKSEVFCESIKTAMFSKCRCWNKKLFYIFHLHFFRIPYCHNCVFYVIHLISCTRFWYSWNEAFYQI